MFFGVIFPYGFLLLLLLLTGRDLRYLIAKRRSVNWPTTQATIQKCEAQLHGPFFSLWTSRIPKSLFGYSYVVGGVRYIGFFATARSLALGEAAEMQTVVAPQARLFDGA